jgi:LmbE family N-acetylglucosaminyl deacetylase
MLRHLSTAILAFLLAACGTNELPAVSALPDSGTSARDSGAIEDADSGHAGEPDSGSVSEPDSGSVAEQDAGETTEPDSGSAGEPDAGGPADAGPYEPPDSGSEPVDAGRPDAGNPIDAGSQEPVDAGSGPVDAGQPPHDCDQGARQTRYCGVCYSGTEERYCNGSGHWGSWSACFGETTGYPVTLDGTTPICPPYNRPAVFFAPHPDDETIGMAGSIRHHIEVGRDVFVELMTHGESSGVRSTLDDQGTCDWHSGSHSYYLTSEQFGDARLREFLDALAQLGVRGVFVSDFGDGDVTVPEVSTRIQFWLMNGGTGLSLKGTAGPQDPTAPGGGPQPDHAAVWSALIGSGFSDVRGYLVYHYRTGAGSPTSTEDISAFCDAKRSALSAYQVWAPEAGYYAIGRHSVSELFDAASADCHEFVVYP